MGNLTIKLNLSAIPGAAITEVGKNKTECLCIPIEMANLFKGEKGCYLDLTAIPLKEMKAYRKDTHLVKQAYSKDKFAAMTDEQKNAIPIIGNVIDWDKQGGGSTGSTTTASSAPPAWL